MSESVANAMKLKNKEELSSTVEFIQYINKAFDCLNVNSLYAGGNSKNDNLNAYTSLDDPRLQVTVICAAYAFDHFIRK